MLTLVEQSEHGELRFKAADYDELEKSRLLVLDWDRKKGEIVLRATSGYGAVVKVNPEAAQWSLPLNEAPTERARLAATAASARSSVLDDEQLADLEEKMARERQAASDVADGKSPTRIRIRQ